MRNCSACHPHPHTHVFPSQMIGLAVKAERPELEEAREKLVLEDAANKATLKSLEDRILSLLAASSGNILDDDVLIGALGESKATSSQITRQVEAAERTAAKIAAARAAYAPLARRASALFFVVADLAHVDPMYQVRACESRQAGRSGGGHERLCGGGWGVGWGGGRGCTLLEESRVRLAPAPHHDVSPHTRPVPRSTPWTGTSACSLRASSGRRKQTRLRRG